MTARKKPRKANPHKPPARVKTIVRDGHRAVDPPVAEIEERVEQAERKSRGEWIGLAVGVAAALAVIGFLLFSGVH